MVSLQVTPFQSNNNNNSSFDMRRISLVMKIQSAIKCNCYLTQKQNSDVYCWQVVNATFTWFLCKCPHCQMGSTCLVDVCLNAFACMIQRDIVVTVTV
jgi:hypothetical protein